METVKVDIQKLQLLNDRIAQMIDALNQVRMSAHGIQHTPQTYGAVPFGGGYGAYPTPQPGFVQQFNPYTSPYTPSPYTTSPYAGSFLGNQLPVPFTTPPFTTSPFTTSPFTTSPFVGGLQHAGWPTPYTGNGISHTPWDPTWQWRTGQLFPFTQTPVSIT